MMKLSLSEVLDIYLKKRSRCVSLGKGEGVTAVISEVPGTLDLTIQTKLNSDNVIGGNVIYSSEEWINPCGGKRVLDINMSYKTASLLHAVLEDILRDVRMRQRCELVLGENLDSIDNIMMESDFKVH